MLDDLMAQGVGDEVAAWRERTAELEAAQTELADAAGAAAEAERDALADRVLDLGRELEALRAAVRAHRSAHEAGEGETVALVRLYQLAGLT